MKFLQNILEILLLIQYQILQEFQSSFCKNSNWQTLGSPLSLSLAHFLSKFLLFDEILRYIREICVAESVTIIWRILETIPPTFRSAAVQVILPSVTQHRDRILRNAEILVGSFPHIESWQSMENADWEPLIGQWKSCHLSMTRTALLDLINRVNRKWWHRWWKSSNRNLTDGIRSADEVQYWMG